MFMFPQLFILVIVGLSPTIVAFMIDRSPKKYATFCVGGMNVSGVFPSFLNLWTEQNGIKDILTNPFDVTIMFASAAFGWLLFVAIPPVIKSLLTVVAHHRIAVMRGKQKEMIRDWGEGIAIGPKAIEVREANLQDNMSAESRSGDIATIKSELGKN